MVRKPDFVIIGAMKCATSTLHEQLAAQPGVFMSTPKEPNFFSDDPIWARGIDWYLALFDAAAPGDLCGESSTHYTKLPTHPNTVTRVAEHLPDARFVYVMRHPVDRLVSHYVHEWTQRVIDAPIGEAVDRHPELVDYGCYARQLRPWLERFGPSRVLPVFFDRLRAHPQAELERVSAFLGYTGTASWRDDLEPQNVSSQRMRQSPLRDLLVNAPLLSTIRRRLVPQWMRDRVKELWMMRDRPTLDPAERARLEARFDRDLSELGMWLGTPLRCASFRETTRDRELGWTDAAPGPADSGA